MRPKNWLKPVGLLVCLLFATKSFATVYEIDPEHSSVSFKIRHLVSKTQGQFKKFSGTIDYNEKEPTSSKVIANIEVPSIDTGVKKRDDHLLSDKDFFDANNFPKMTFESLKVSKIKEKGKKAEVVGKLTIKGVTKPVILDVEMLGASTNPFSNKPVIGFTGKTKINRKEWGVTWNMDKDGNALIGDEVEILLEIEAMKKS